MFSRFLKSPIANAIESQSTRCHFLVSNIFKYCSYFQNRDALALLIDDDDARDEFFQRVDCPLKHQADPNDPTKRVRI